ncbi:MAG: hypothetical protein IJK08_10650, partial [Prevotella sp.]|nr:hypothetical protein [Prevotella sp.]
KNGVLLCLPNGIGWYAHQLSPCFYHVFYFEIRDLSFFLWVATLKIFQNLWENLAIPLHALFC